jgi:hypothetical protein
VQRLVFVLTIFTSVFVLLTSAPRAISHAQDDGERRGIQVTYQGSEDLSSENLAAKMYPTIPPEWELAEGQLPRYDVLVVVDVVTLPQCDYGGGMSHLFRYEISVDLTLTDLATGATVAAQREIELEKSEA